MNPYVNKIKLIIFQSLIFISLFGVWMIAKPVIAQVNPLLNFAGKVTNTDGSEVADGTYNFSFGLYQQTTGGSAIWSEDLTAATRFSGTISNVTAVASGIRYTYTGGSATSTFRLGQYLSNASTSIPALIIDYNAGANTVTVASGSVSWSIGAPINNRPFVEGGVININLGSVTDISNIDFNQTLYLEVTFNGEVMQPRKVLTTEVAAFQAARIGDKTEAELAALADNETITGEWSFNNIVSIATSSDTAALTVTQSGSGNIVEFKLGASTAFAVLADGRVQIGNYRFPTTYGNAGYVLKTDASGDLYWDQDFVGGFGASGNDMLWASNTLETLIRPIDTADVVVVGNIATTTMQGMIFEVQGSSLFDMVNISNQQQVRFYDADSSNSKRGRVCKRWHSRTNTLLRK